MDAAREAKLSLRRMVVETFLPALEEGSWTLVWDGRDGFVKTAASSGTSLDIGDEHAAPLALRLSLDNAPHLPKKIDFSFANEVSAEQRSLPQWADLQIPLIAAPDWDWRRANISEDATNLLSGDFTPRAKIQEWLPKLRPLAYLLLAILAVEIVGSNLEWAMMANETNRLTKDMQRTFRTTFGDSVTLVNAPLQMQRNLAELRHTVGVPDSGDFLPLLNQAGHSLATLPVGSVTGIHYEAGRLDIEIKLARQDDFSILKQSMQNSGLVVRMGEIRDLGNGVQAKLTLLPEGTP